MTERDDIKAVLTKAFKSVDKDGNGWIDAAEIKTVLTAYYQSNKKPYDAAKLEEDTNVRTFAYICLLLSFNTGLHICIYSTSKCA